MTFLPVTKAAGRGGSGVSVAWRVPSGRKGHRLCIGLGKPACAALGLSPDAKGEAKQRVVVEHCRDTGRLRIALASWQPADQQVSPAWKDGGCTIAIRWTDIVGATQPRANVDWAMHGAAMLLRLPAWACPLVQVAGGRTHPAISGRAA